MTALSEIVRAVRDLLGDVPLLVGLGGGADSAVAAWACSRRGPTRGVFVDHALPSSTLVGDSAEALTGHLGIGFDTVAGAVDDGPDLEQRSRLVRRRALLDSLRGNERLVLAHTQTDQAETVLMNLSRGAGAVGLSGMQPLGGAVVRPLLGFPRATLRAAAVGLGLPFADDPANADPRFTRNRFRGEVLPAIEAIRMGSTAAIARSASHLAADEEAIAALAGEIPVRRDGDAVLVPIPVLATVGKAIAFRALARAAAALGDPMSSHDVDAIYGVVAGAPRSQLSKGRFADREGPYVVIWRPPAVTPEPVVLSVPGVVEFGEHRLTIRCSAGGPSSLALDPAVLDDDLFVRAAIAGDRIDIGGGSKLVRDALAERGVPRRLRSAWPVVMADAKIAAVPAVRVASWARSGGQEALTLTDERPLW